jgi:hypothetical protein
LREVAMPEHAISLALALLTIGVEAGQVLFIAAFFAVVWAKWSGAARMAATASGSSGLVW